MAQRTSAVTVDDARSGLGLERFHYTGRWERVRAMNDGRAGGTSTRSPFLGSSFAVAFRARRCRVYGVTGPTGGHGILALDQNIKAAVLDFYSPRKRTHVLLYSSPRLDAGLHSISVIVNGTRDRSSRGTYVNIDSVDIDT
jgi:hypothetical protein